MTARFFGIVVAVMIVDAGIASAFPLPATETCGRVLDAITGLPIAGVDISAFCIDEPEESCQRADAVTDSVGTYCFWLDPSVDTVVYSAAGYRSRLLRWPQDLSPSWTYESCPEDFKDVYLVPREVP